jgi:signal transduction histidine kinase
MPPRVADNAFPVEHPPLGSGVDEAKQSFLRMVSHELRTPLNAVIGFAEIIQTELHGPIGDPRYKGHAEIIRDSGLKLLKLVNQVLEIARLDAHAADLRIAPEAPAPIVTAAIRDVQGEAAARAVVVRQSGADAAPLALADPRGLHTALVNLLQNAIAHSPAGGEVMVRVRAGRNSVLFEVRDDGPGVATAELHRLVRPFEQAENALVRRTHGAGLGLSIVSLLCREMGGSLALRSSPGRGMTARIRLPSAEPTSCAATRPQVELETERPAA